MTSTNNRTELVTVVEEQLLSPCRRRRTRQTTATSSFSTSSLPSSFLEEEESPKSSASSSSSSSSVTSSSRKRRRKSGESTSSTSVAVGEAKLLSCKNQTLPSPPLINDTTTTTARDDDSKIEASSDDNGNINKKEENEEFLQLHNFNNDNDDDKDYDDDDEVEFLLTIKPSSCSNNNNNNNSHHHHHTTMASKSNNDQSDDDDDDDEVEFISSLSLNEIMMRARCGGGGGGDDNQNAAAAAVAEPSKSASLVPTENTNENDNDDSRSSTTAIASSLPPERDSATPATTTTTNSSSNTTSTCMQSTTSLDFHGSTRQKDRKLLPRVSEEGMVANTTLVEKTHHEDTAATTATDKTPLSSSPLLSSSSSSSSSELSFPLISSAYLQNLAEICSIITDDARWRVLDVSSENNNNAPLFRWEDGDDLSAIIALKQLYQPLARTRRHQSTNCSCLLCRDQKVKSITSIQQNPKNEDEDAQEEDDSTFKSSALSTPKNDKDIRWLYLYCRLFYRRGPWFRLDDIYERYYKPKMILQQSVCSSSEAMETAINDKTRSLLDVNDEANNAAAAAASASNTTRFKELNGKRAAPPVVNETVLSMFMDRLDDLIHDLSRLQAAGLIRSFHGEEECGKTVGASPLLTQDLRTIVLSKLGCGTAKKKPQQPQGQQPKGRHTTMQPKKLENEIWNQMNRQKSIFASSSNTGSDKSLLPVCKHVDEVILQKLVTDILKNSCAIPFNAHLPVAISRTWANQLKAKIRQTAKTVGVLSSLLDNNGGFSTKTKTSMTCFRLREKPTLTLQRCCRLFLCATNGPGQMRGDETNGWKSLKNMSDHINSSNPPPPLVKRVKPPCRSTWYQVSYPGCAYRFGIMSAHFLDAYEPVRVDDKNSATSNMTNASSSWGSTIQVFASRDDFRAWEMCVELRANVDYLNELNDQIRGEERRQRRRQSEASDTDQESSEVVASTSSGGSVDFMALLTESGRHGVLMTLLSSWGISHECRGSLVKSLQEQIQNDIQHQLDGTLKDEWEQILGIIAVLSIHVLGARNDWISDRECSRMESKPWLRHMWWDGNLAYILWDIIPLLERRNLHVLAVRGLEILLFGSCEKTQQTTSFMTSRLAPLLLSRRARGKVCDRLVIDYTHLNRLKNRTLEDTSSRKEASNQAALEVLQFCEKTIAVAAHSAFISFSSLRSLARRLKQPLATTLNGAFCTEANELGLRLENESSPPTVEEQEDEDKKKSRYSDWEPITDRTIANAVAGVDNGAGARCVFIGHEDGSLNVEELAMEYYQSGRLPVVAEGDMDEALSLHTGGGWFGWHDEGGHIRALFRILCAGPILGMDWGCCEASSTHADTQTIHLSPYQGAPFDLHVGFGLRYPTLSIKEHQQEQTPGALGFYYRRQEKIDSFLGKLANLSPQEICDLVHNSIGARLEFMAQTARKDPSLERDLEKLRTISLIAAGTGGKQLAAIFRCFFFDYRHYSGGLPDLLLVRARFRSEGAPPSLVDLSGWIGESFSHEHQAELQVQRGAAMLADDEFLGCSKVGDSGTGGGRRNRSGTSGRTRQTSKSVGPKKALSLDDLPPKLELVYNGQPVIPECLMVEVKSSNDRLDARQEDWLNILDRSGKNCRVCKFEASNKNRPAGKKAAAPKTATSAK